MHLPCGCEVKDFEPFEHGDAVVGEGPGGVGEAGDLGLGAALAAAPGAEVVAGLGAHEDHLGEGVVVAEAEGDFDGGGEEGEKRERVGKEEEEMHGAGCGLDIASRDCRYLGEGPLFKNKGSR